MVKPRALAAVALCWIVAVRTLLSCSRSIADLERLLERTAARLPALPAYDVRLAAWAITAAARRVSGTRCLAWSLALRALLLQMGVASQLRIGVAPAAPGELDAHAWVRCDGQDWSWGGGAVDRYGVLRRCT